MTWPLSPCPGDVLFQMAEVHRQIQNQLEEMVSRAQGSSRAGGEGPVSCPRGRARWGGSNQLLPTGFFSLPLSRLLPGDSRPKGCPPKTHPGLRAHRGLSQGSCPSDPSMGQYGKDGGRLFLSPVRNEACWQAGLTQHPALASHADAHLAAGQGAPRAAPLSRPLPEPVALRSGLCLPRASGLTPALSVCS